MSQDVRQGSTGDYDTSPTVHPLFGSMVAKQLVQMWTLMDAEEWTVLEMGAGEGYLCHDILSYLREREPQNYNRCRYYIVEKNPCVWARVEARLGVFGDVVQRYPGLRELTDGSIVGCIISNELIDAFPVHRVVMTEEGLRELYVSWRDARCTEVLAPPSTPLLEEYFRRLGIVLVPGQQAEVHLEAVRWIGHVSRVLAHGFVITIDYGYEAHELYSPDRMSGTLRSFRGHTRVHDLYADPGRQDLTADVDFTALIQWGNACGLSCAGMVPQYRFLLAMGFTAELERHKGADVGEDCLVQRLAAKRLIVPQGLGTRWKALIQYKGVRDPLLDGLRTLTDGGV